MNKTVLMIVSICSFLVGAAFMQGWHIYRAREDKALLGTLPDASSVWVTDMQNAAMPDGVTSAQTAPEVQAVTVPSQLSKIDLPEVQTIISRSGAEFTPASSGEEKDSTLPVVDATAVVSNGQSLPVKVADPAGESKITLIEAPVEVQVLSSLDDYRQFKRQARGNYPEVDFAKQNVLVLQSTSNLPDKVFEIQTVTDENGKRVITYRVSVFGLDKKTNTHSVAVVDKSDLPLELKQVL